VCKRQPLPLCCRAVTTAQPASRRIATDVDPHHHQEAVMSKPVPVQHPAVVLRSQYRNLRSLIAVLLVAIAALSATVAVLAINDDGVTTSTSSVANGRSYPTLEDPFQARTQPTRPQSSPDESAIASSISQTGGRSYPTLNDPFQSRVEQPRPLDGPKQQAEAFVRGH
jgi:hypothetical protein